MTVLRRRWRGFGEPLILLVLTIGGLIAALVGVGFVKAAGVLSAALPIFAIARHLLRARAAPDRQRTRP